VCNNICTPVTQNMLERSGCWGDLGKDIALLDYAHTAG
jgi:hypothetical protein